MNISTTHILTKSYIGQITGQHMASDSQSLQKAVLLASDLAIPQLIIEQVQ